MSGADGVSSWGLGLARDFVDFDEAIAGATVGGKSRTGRGEGERTSGLGIRRADRQKKKE